MLSHLILAALIALASFAFQVRPRLLNRYFGVDTWRFLMLADYIRQHKRLPRKIEGKYLVEGPVDNPPFLPLILSLLPKGWLENYQWLVSPAIDAAHNLLVFAIAYALTQNYAVAHLAQVIYALTPIVALEASSLSLRSIGSLVFCLAFLAMLAFAVERSLPWFGAAVLATLWLILTHRMSTQVLFLVGVAFSLYERDPAYLALFLIAFALAFVVTGSYYAQILRGHLLMIGFWWHNIDNKLAHQIRGNPRKGAKQPDVVRRVQSLIWRVPVLPLLPPNPWTLLALGGVALSYSALRPIEGVFASPYYGKFAAWAISAFLMASAIAYFRPLRCIGEGERYLEYATLPTAVLAATAAYDLAQVPGLGPILTAGLVVFALVGCILPTVYFQQRVVVHGVGRSYDESQRRIVAHLNGLREEVRLACVPWSLADAIMYHAKGHVRILTTDNSMGVWALQDFAPLVMRPLSDILARYQVNYLLVAENYVSVAELGLPDAQAVLREGPYCLLKTGENTP